MSKKRYVTINLNGENFILDTKETKEKTSLTGAYDIMDVYGRCSDIKRAIWMDWQKWFLHNDGFCTILSHNCNFFTIHGYVKDHQTNKEYYCYITCSYNRCIEIA